MSPPTVRPHTYTVIADGQTVYSGPSQHHAARVFTERVQGDGTSQHATLFADGALVAEWTDY